MMDIFGPNERLGDNEYVTREELREALMALEVTGDGSTTFVTQEPGGRVVHATAAISPPQEDSPLIRTSYDSTNDQYVFSWDAFYVQTRYRDSVFVADFVQIPVDAGEFRLTPGSGNIALTIGYVDSKYQIYWSNGPSSTHVGADAFTLGRQCVAVGGKYQVGMIFRIYTTAAGTPPATTGDETLRFTLDHIYDLRWQYYTSIKKVFVTFNFYSIDTIGSGTTLVLTLGNSFNDSIILGWDDTNVGNQPVLDAAANAGDYTYTRTIGTAATDASGNVTNLWIGEDVQAPFGYTGNATVGGQAAYFRSGILVRLG